MEKISDKYHLYYNDNKLWEQTKWLGVPIWKNPCDLLVLQELLFKIKPQVIIETGTKFGGSALFFASMLELMEIDGKVITMDIENFVGKEYFDANETLRMKIILHKVSSLNKYMIEFARECSHNKRTMVVLDSWHSEEHVLKELEAYHEMVSVGSHLIVEDTHINNPVEWPWENRGPGAAVEQFLIEHPNYEVDRDCEKLIWTFNPGGWIRRIS